MGSRCKLCGTPVRSGRESVRCRCGQHLHADCQRDHETTCPSADGDRWVGAQEF